MIDRIDALINGAHIKNVYSGEITLDAYSYDQFSTDLKQVTTIKYIDPSKTIVYKGFKVTCTLEGAFKKHYRIIKLTTND